MFIKLHTAIHLTTPVFDSTVYKALPRAQARLGAAQAGWLAQPTPRSPHPPETPPKSHAVDVLLQPAEAQLRQRGVDRRVGARVPKGVARRVDREVGAAHLDELLGKELGAVERRRQDRVLRRAAAGGGWWEYVGLNDGPPADVVRVVRMLVARARVACVHACAQSPSTRIAVVKWR